MTMAVERPEIFRLGFDIGGTFTDIVLASREGTVRTTKVLTTSDDIMRGVIDGLRRLLDLYHVSDAEIDDTIAAAASTVVTNLVIEGKGARTGLLTTKGFRDVLSIGRELRYDVYDLTAGFPNPLVTDQLRIEVTERVDFRGRVVEGLSLDEAAAGLRALSQQGATSLAVCLLHAYANSEHEKRIKALAAQVCPDLPVSLSSEVLPEIREYERTVATVLNAYVQPHIQKYLSRIEEGLKSVLSRPGLRLMLMQSNGGLISRSYAESFPIRMLESGPAAGALAASHLAKTCGIQKILAFDMGGTTAKACLVTDSVPEVTNEFETARVHRFKQGSGYPIRLPVIDLIEIGAGGGSIARIDQTGLLKVGPTSAGAKPGPASYGLGGTKPTVTDAALVLGYLGRHATLGGSVSLNYDKAHAAIDSDIARPLGLSTEDAAIGIYRIVCEQMAAAAKIHAVEKGRDLREYALIAFGGAGPIHACEVARRLGCKEILIPPDAGVFSAVGLLLAPNRVDAVRSHCVQLSNLNWPEVRALFEEMKSSVAEALKGSHVDVEDIVYQYSADMRYVGQGFEVNAPLPLLFDASATAVIAESFSHAYAAKFGRALADVSIEVVSWRVSGATKTGWLGATLLPPARRTRGNERIKRPVYFLERGAFVTTDVYSAGDVPVEKTLNGPALIEQDGSTIAIGPDDSFVIDPMGVTRIRVAALAGYEVAGSEL